MKRAKKQDQITLRRAIYQPMQLAFQRGRLIETQIGTNKVYRTGPNLRMIPRANKAYEKMADADPEYRDHIRNAHKNFLKDAVYFLYTQNRRTEADQWLQYLVKQYPDATIYDVRDPAKPPQKIAGMTVDDYSIARVTEDVGETSRIRITEIIEGLLINSFYSLAISEDDEATGYALMAQKVWARYTTEIKDQTKRIGLPPFGEMQQAALRLFESEYDPVLVNQYRTKLGLPALPPRAAAEPEPGSSANP